MLRATKASQFNLKVMLEQAGVKIPLTKFALLCIGLTENTNPIIRKIVTCSGDYLIVGEKADKGEKGYNAVES